MSAQLLSSRLAVVTGAGSGIGWAVGQIFAKQGASIAAVDVNESAAKEHISKLGGGEHGAFQADISKSDQVNDLFKKIFEKFGRAPTILINSAGITRDVTLLKMNEEQLDAVLNVNLKGTILTTQVFGKLFVANKLKDGAIVNLASLAGKMGNIGQCNYSASKAGVQGFTRSAAQEFARFGLRVNAILPGFIETPMTDVVPEQNKQIFTAMTPLKRLGQPEEIANVALFLSSHMSSYMTGVSIDVNGGLSM
ncbi:DgyrCDS10472 [Dimorphilus gyrociliatus]|uniref:(3R)-3-hydroxyacyl-CoA dehydrogenase n=1 Tax=Dimorphilus gyrociliatus TaxID=2664684 RepID=A0A7I8W1G1_9ANNE|nr:DgyrCDS10472 [Dimorphilus gyrociliatus]